MIAYHGQHMGCIGDGCPICARFDADPEKYAESIATLMGEVAPSPGGCPQCGDKEAMDAKSLGQAVLTPRATITFARDNLVPEIQGVRFNASCFLFDGRWLMAWRNRTSGSHIYLTEFDADWRAARTSHLALSHRLSAGGREDPRLFTFRGQLHLAYVGVYKLGGAVTTHVLYAPLEENQQGWRATRIFYPDFQGRASWEKNWEFFEADGALHATYSIHGPRRILRVDGSNAALLGSSEWRSPWRGGVMRGGASPVRVGDRFYSWFHGSIFAGKQLTYTAGVYTFAAEAPFKPLACTAWPVILADEAKRPADEQRQIVFPCGAFLDGDTWTVSMGMYDRWIEVRQFAAADVDAALSKVTPKIIDLECVKRGKRLEKVVCPICPHDPNGKPKQVQVYECSQFGKCTLANRVDDAAGCCSGCGKRVAK